jgi:hypothetical protein
LKSVKKAFSRWLRLVLPLLAGASAAAGGTLWDGSLKVGGLGQFAAAEADLVRYQVGGKGQHGPLAILADLVALSGQFEKPFLQSAPYSLMATDLFSGRTDDREQGVLVGKVSDEGYVNFSVLVSQGHLTISSSAPWRFVSGWIVADLFRDWAIITSAPANLTASSSLNSRITFRPIRTLMVGDTFGLSLSTRSDSSMASMISSAHFGVQPGRLVNGGFPKSEGVKA